MIRNTVVNGQTVFFVADDLGMPVSFGYATEQQAIEVAELIESSEGNATIPSGVDVTAKQPSDEQLDRLSQAEILKLAEHKKSLKGDEVCFVVCGWRVLVTHHIHTGGHWSAGAWHAGSSYFAGERCLSGNDSEAMCWSKVADFIKFATSNPVGK